MREQFLGGGDAAALVIGPHGHPVGRHRQQLVEQRHVLPATPGIHGAPIDSALLGEPDHGQDRCHADAADHEQHLALIGDEVERVAGAFELDRVAHVEGVVHFDRAAAAVGDPTHRDAVVGAPPGRTAQRVLAAAARSQPDIDVRAGSPGRQQSALRVGERQRDDVGREKFALGDHRGVGPLHRHDPRRIPPRRRGQTAEEGAHSPQRGVEAVAFAATVQVGGSAAPNRMCHSEFPMPVERR